jgi:hypothetical protein
MTLTMESLQEQINELRNEVTTLKKAAAGRKVPVGLVIGEKFELAGLMWRILDITDKGYMCLADKLEDSMSFANKTNNWSDSGLREYLDNVFLEKIAGEIGKENIIPFNRNLLSLDGQTEYGECEDMVSLLTVDEYRKYRKLIPNAGYWWWTCTPWSTESNSYEVETTVVSPSGNFYNRYCNNNNGVRPACIFSSSIFESED